METFAPVVKLVPLRLLLTYAAIHDLDIVHWDVVAAFLTGDLTEEVFMFQPPGFDEGSGRVGTSTNPFTGYASLHACSSRSWTIYSLKMVGSVCIRNGHFGSILP